jgi:hypothetical protein
MAPFNNSKRTRSQLTLPALSPSMLGRSPLKNAKLALRHAPNSQVQLHLQTRQPSKLRNATGSSSSSLDGEATDEEDEILLSPNKRKHNSIVTMNAINKDLNKNKKRLSGEHEHDFAQDGNGDRRESKRAKTMDSSGNDSDAENRPSTSLIFEQKKKAPFQHERSVDSQRGRLGSPSVPRVDLRTGSPALPWRSSSPTTDGMGFKMTPRPRDPSLGTMDVDMDAPPTPTPAPKPPSTPRPTSPTPLSSNPPSFTPLTPQSQTPQGFNLGSGSGLAPGRTAGSNVTMSPLTPLPPTPAIFGGPLRAFTLGKGVVQSVSVSEFLCCVRVRSAVLHVFLYAWLCFLFLFELFL